MELSKLRLILGCCWCIGQMWGIHSHNINLQADQSQCVTPEKTDGSEEQWDISAPDDTYLRLNCIIRVLIFSYASVFSETFDLYFPPDSLF